MAMLLLYSVYRVQTGRILNCKLRVFPDFYKNTPSRYSINMTIRYPFRQDAAYLDDQYNNRLRVPDFVDRHVLLWQAASTSAQREQASVLDVAYGAAASDTLDIFPAGGTCQPVLVFLHGGYWRSLDKKDHSFLAPSFTQQGVFVVVPNYALCSAVGTTTIEDISLQCARAVAWIYQNIDQYGGDPGRITVVGHSAGGHLAAMMAACEWDKLDATLPKQLLRNALSISGLYDLAPIMASPYLQQDLKLTATQVVRCSPAYFAKPRAALYAVCGGDESDEFLRQNRLIEQAWGSAHVPVREAMPGHNHFSILETLTQPAHRTHQLAMQLLRS
jgi:arylformamidase